MIALLMAAALCQSDQDAPEPKAKPKAEAPAPLDAKELAALKAKVRGRVGFNRKTGELTLTYDLANKRQFEDFGIKLKSSPPVPALALDTGDKAEHVVGWWSVAVKATVTTKRMRGDIVTTENGVRMGTGGAGADSFGVVVGGRNEGVVAAPDSRTGNVPIYFETNAKKTVGSWGSARVANAGAESPAGHVTFHGGELGFAYSAITFTGIPDRGWLKTFLAAK